MSGHIARAGWLIVVLTALGLDATGAAPVRLIEAIKAADTDAIRTLLQQRVDVNAAEPSALARIDPGLLAKIGPPSFSLTR